LSDAAVEVDNVTFYYKKSPALLNVSLRIRKGSFTVLLGANGSGKSTLLKLVAGLLKPSKGRVRTLGVDPYKEFRLIASRVFYFFEQDTIPRDLRVADVLEEFSSLYNGDVVDKFAEALGVKAFRNKYVKELSQGYRMRLHLVEALSSQREIVLLDEPFRGIDQSTRMLLSRVINSSKATGQTLIVATHIMAGLDPDKIVVLDEGRILYEGDLSGYKSEGCILIRCGDKIERKCGEETLLELKNGCMISSVLC